jgi:hypothetical protein
MPKMVRKPATKERTRPSRNVDESMDKLFRANRRAMDDLARK